MRRNSGGVGSWSLGVSSHGRTPCRRAATKTIKRSPAIFVGTFLPVYKRFGSTSIRFEGLDCSLTVPGFIDKSAFIRSLSRFVRPLRHSDLVQEDEVIDLSWLGPCGRMWLWGFRRSSSITPLRGERVPPVWSTCQPNRGHSHLSTKPGADPLAEQYVGRCQGEEASLAGCEVQCLTRYWQC